MKHNGFFSKSLIVKHYSSDDLSNQSIADFGSDKGKSASLLLKIRTSFATMCEQSSVAGALERLYLSLLACPLSVLGTFLAVFSLVSLCVRFFVSGPDITVLLNGINFSAIMIFILALTFLPVKKSVSELVSSSLFLSKFEIAYDSKVLKASNKGAVPHYSYSTAVFLGMLCGIVSSLVSPVSVLSYTALLVCSLIIFNRPECGILTSAFILPLLENKFVILVTALTAFSYLYKYLRCKRHFYYGNDEKILFACSLIFLVSGIFTKSGIVSAGDSLKFISLIVIYLCVKNLIKSISLLNGCIKLISVSSTLISAALAAFYLLTAMAPFIKLGFIDGTRIVASLRGVIISDSHIFSVIAITLPLNFSLFIGKDASGSRLRYGITVLIQLFCVTVYRDTGIITACIFSMIIVIAFRYFKSLLLLPFTPFISQLLLKVSRMLPRIFDSSVHSTANSKTASAIIYSAIRDNPLIGIGIGQSNFVKAISVYSIPGSENLIHPETSFISMLLSFGLPASILLLITAAHLISKNMKYAIINKGKNSICDTASAGLFASCTCAGFLFFTMFYTSNVSAAALFSVMLGLGCCINECVNSDFIDNNRLR